MDQRNSSLEAANSLLSHITDLREPLSNLPDWLKRPPLEAMFRSALIRQIDVFEATIGSVSRGEGYASALVVRPAIEEFIALSYLVTLEEEHASTYISLRARQETFRTLQAQRQKNGDKAMKAMGFSKSYMNKAQENSAKVEAQMVSLGEELGWTIFDRNGKHRCDGPGVPFMAEAVGQQALYQYLYSASSATVHFSPRELMRRMWFSPEAPEHARVSSQSFEPYWAAFALGWSAVLLLRTIGLAMEWPGLDALPWPEYPVDVLEKVKGLVAPPMITAEEMNLTPSQLKKQ